jgi:hypothetical protein
MIEVSFKDGHEVFNSCIKTFVMQEFPAKLSPNNCELIDLLTNELLGSKQVRLGPKPSVESQVSIRDVIRFYVGMNHPLPFMVPWGSEKPDGSSIDIAELMGLKTFIALQQRISSHYEPGIQLNIRLEDASAPHLFNENPVKAWMDADRYSSAFADMVEILGAGSFIKVKRESYAVTVPQFNEVADSILPFMKAYLQDLEIGYAHVNDSFLALNELGWKGHVSKELREYYYYSYDKLYPGCSQQFKIEKLARYFSGALARTKLGIRGDDKDWNGHFIDLSFVQNPPGTDSRFSRRVIYRTIPSEYSSNHIPPWRAKGYLTINDEGKAIPKLVSFNDMASLPLESRILTLTKGELSVDIKADFMAV